MLEDEQHYVKEMSHARSLRSTGTHLHRSIYVCLTIWADSYAGLPKPACSARYLIVTSHLLTAQFRQILLQSKCVRDILATSTVPGPPDMGPKVRPFRWLDSTPEQGVNILRRDVIEERRRRFEDELGDASMIPLRFELCRDPSSQVRIISSSGELESVP